MNPGRLGPLIPPHGYVSFRRTPSRDWRNNVVWSLTLPISAEDHSQHRHLDLKRVPCLSKLVEATEQTTCLLPSSLSRAFLAEYSFGSRLLKVVYVS